MNNTGVIFIAGIGFIAVGLLIGWATFNPSIDNDYLCICGSSTGGDTVSGYTPVPVTQDPPGRCPHDNPDNNLFCDG